MEIYEKNEFLEIYMDFFNRVLSSKKTDVFENLDKDNLINISAYKSRLNKYWKSWKYGNKLF